MSDVRLVTLDNGRLAAVTPYHTGFITEAKTIGGKWDRAARAWTFDARDAERVRGLLRDYFGTDGSSEANADLVTVRTPLYRHELSYREGAKARFAGRIIATRPSRDEDVRLASNVILVAGELPSTGGSVRYPQINADADAIVEIRDIPRAALDVEDPDDYEIVDRTIDAETLRAERARLLERLAEIDAALAAAGESTGDEDDQEGSGRAIPVEQPGRTVITVSINAADDTAQGATVKAVAAAVGRSARTIRRWCAAGRLAATRTSRGWVITA